MDSFTVPSVSAVPVTHVSFARCVFILVTSVCSFVISLIFKWFAL